MNFHGKDIKIFAGSSNLTVAKGIADGLGLPLGKSDCCTFSDGEIAISLNESVRGSECFIVQSTCDPVNDNLMELLIMIDAMKRASAARITAVMPYFGYARQDRKAKPRDPISAKLVADLITTAGADRLLTMDLHANQIQGFFNIPVDHLLGAPLLAKYMKENSDVEFDFLADYLREFTEKYQLFRKYDTHMNNLGGYITNEKIVQDMTGESLPIEDIQVMIGTKPCRGDLSRMIGRYKELNDDREYGLNYFHDGIRYKVKKEESEGGEEILKVFKSNSDNEKTLMVIGDSFRLRLEKYMPYRYQKTIFVRIDDFDQELLDKYEPDDVIVITVERDQRYMEKLDSYIIQDSGE